MNVQGLLPDLPAKDHLPSITLSPSRATFHFLCEFQDTAITYWHRVLIIFYFILRFYCDISQFIYIIALI